MIAPSADDRPVRLVLASASTARRATLRAAGFDPEVRVSEVDEDAVLAALLARPAPAGAADQVLALARAKAEDVAAAIAADAPQEPVLVVGCDSMLETGAPPTVVGKPHTAAVARERWRTMRGSSGVLHTGHWLVLLPGAARIGARTAPPRREVGASSATRVHFADVTDAEIDAYVASGEPLEVAGAFTIDGLGGQFVRGIEGDHHGVVGISLPMLRELAAHVGLRLTDLWRADGPDPADAGVGTKTD